jgi:hypothetical protein
VSRVAQSLQCLAMGWMTGRWWFNPRQRRKNFSSISVSRPALRHTQHLVRWVPEVLFPGPKRGRDVTPTTHPPLVPRSRMSRSYTSSQALSWLVVGQQKKILTSTQCRPAVVNTLGTWLANYRPLASVASVVQELNS